ncbi:MAG TPA: Rv3235 family protein [Mycobacteriales bacterium]|nr:Rv3235 family protein [Mycobacteriales bacterium]
MTDSRQAAEQLAQVFGLRRAPRFEGPYDDERPDPPAQMVDGSLALAFPPSVSNALPLRLVPPARAEDLAPEPCPPSQVPSPRRFVAPFAQGVAEVLMGVRPPQQLAQAATLDVLGQLERNAGRLAPRLAARTATRPRPRVSSVRLCEPAEGVAEVCAVVDTGARRRALALRLELIAGRWQCTVLRVG